MPDSPSDEEDPALDHVEGGESHRNSTEKSSLDKIEGDSSEPISGEEPERLVVEKIKDVSVWFMLHILEALIEYWVILILSNGHGPT